MKITVKDAETGNKINLDLEKENTIEEIIESAADYWKKNAGAYVLRHGKNILHGHLNLMDLDVQDQDILELIPDPEGGCGDWF